MVYCDHVTRKLDQAIVALMDFPIHQRRTRDELEGKPDQMSRPLMK